MKLHIVIFIIIGYLTTIALGILILNKLATLIIKKVKYNKDYKFYRQIEAIVFACPAMYWQNILYKNYPYKEQCYKHGLMLCGPYDKCPQWNNRIMCWQAVYIEKNKETK